MRSFVVKNEEAPASSIPTATGYAESASPPTHPYPETAAVVAPAPAGAITLPTRRSYIDGEVDKNDIKTPYLSCVQAVGPKSVMFSPGTLVLGESAITQPPAPQQPTPKLRVLFMRVSKSFVESLPYNPAPGSPRPRVFTKLADVRAVGGVTEWQGNTPPSFSPKALCFALIRCPEGYEDASFNIIADGKTYAPALVSFQKTSYGAAKTLLTDLSLSLAGNPTNTFYDLFWNREPRGSNMVWVAKLVRVREELPTTQIKAIADKLSGGGVSFDEAEETE